MRDRLRSATPLQIDAAIFLLYAGPSLVIVAFLVESLDQWLAGFGFSVAVGLVPAIAWHLKRAGRNKEEARFLARSKSDALASTVRTAAGVSLVMAVIMAAVAAATADRPVLFAVLALLGGLLCMGLVGVSLVVYAWLHPEWQ